MSEFVEVINGVEVDLSFNHQQQCPCCAKNGKDNHEDNLRVYGLDENGKHRGAHCFACGWTFPDQDKIEENENSKINLENIVGLDFNGDIHENIIKKNTTTNVEGFRHISQAVSRRFGIRYEVDDEGNVKKVYYPTTIDNDLVGYKIRAIPKSFQTPYGETGIDCQLFGQFLFPTHNNICLIVGGEHDTLAAYQMLYNSQKDKSFNPTAVVSSTCGEKSTFKQAQKQYAWFNQFKKIIICMDNDVDGQKATESLAKVLPRNRVYIMKLRAGKEYKDPNAYLMNGHQQEFINDFWACKQFTPAGVYSSSQVDESLGDSFKPRLTLPHAFHRLAFTLGGDRDEAQLVTAKNGDKWYSEVGLPTQAINLIAARTSIGKTTIVGELVRHWIKHETNHTIGILSLEDSYTSYGLKLFSSEIGYNLSNYGKKRLDEFLNLPWVLEKRKEFFYRETGEQSFFVIDTVGCNKEVMKEKILELIIQCGVDVLLIDPLIRIFAGMTREDQEDFCSWLISVQEEYKITLNLVGHIVKTETGKDGKKRRPVEDDVKGVSDLASLVKTTILAHRDKSEEDEIERNTTEIWVVKNREGQITGLACRLIYDTETHRLEDRQDWEERKLNENIKKNVTT